MVKVDEALLIGAAILAALVLSKGGGLFQFNPKSKNDNIDNYGISEEQNKPFFKKTITQIPNDIIFKTLNKIPNDFVKKTIQEKEPFLKQIIDTQKIIRDSKIDLIQTELDKTNEYIDEQGKLIPPKQGWGKYSSARGEPVGYLYKDQSQSIIRNYGNLDDDSVVSWFEKLLEDPRNRDPTSQKFPVLPTATVNYYNSIIARRNISDASEIADNQRSQIDLINTEFDTKFNSITDMFKV
jgi:hypothetical protein